MKKQNGPSRRVTLTMRPIQKTSMRTYVVTGSVLALVAFSVLYLIFSRPTDSKASDKKANVELNYQFTEMVVPQRLLQDPTTTARSTQNNYKNSTAKRQPLVTKQSAIVVNTKE